MSSPKSKYVQILHYLPDKFIKKEMDIEIGEEDYNIPCRFCSKVFANEVAIKNHVGVYHMGEEVDIEVWADEAKMVTNANEMQEQTESQPNVGEQVEVTNFTCEDVNYIIVRTDEIPPNAKRRKTEETPTGNNDEHTVSGPFECLEPRRCQQDITCHQIFFSCCDYSIHYREEHTKRRKGVKCQVCEKLLAPPIGEDIEPYRCQLCGIGLKSESGLSDHMAIDHTRLKPYFCKVCHKRFTQLGGLQQHMRMHTGDRPYPCVYCAKAFTQKSGLDQHLRTHTKEKPYRCIICQKTFSQSVHIKQHMRTHTNVKPFQCAVCYKKFKQSSHLNYHLKHHDVVNLTDDQKAKYKEMLGMITKTDISGRDEDEKDGDDKEGDEKDGDEEDANDKDKDNRDAVEQDDDVDDTVEYITGSF